MAQAEATAVRPAGCRGDRDGLRVAVTKGQRVDFNEYVEQALKTLVVPEDEALDIALLGVAGEAGSIVSEAKKWARAGRPPGTLPDVEEELGDLLWYVACVASAAGIDLNAAAESNLRKVHEMWSTDLPAPSNFDDATRFGDHERFPRRFEVRFYEHRVEGGNSVVIMEPVGPAGELYRQRRNTKNLGDPLDDNAYVEDGYRFHDIIHLAHATVLGWSPVLRSHLGVKRTSNTQVDRVEDGARAIALEEGLSAFVFNYLEPTDFVVSDRLPWDLLKHIRRTVRGLEVAELPGVSWTAAYRQAFELFHELRRNGGGIVSCDLDRQHLRYDADGN